MPPLSTLDKNAFPCIKCPLHFATKAEQADHLESGEGFDEPWICHQCPTRCVTENALRAHVIAIHGRSVFDKYGKGGYYCGAARDCGPPFGEVEDLNRHMKHDHINQLLKGKTDGRVCLASGCGFTNDSCVGLSLHNLHYHSPKCGCGAMFWKVDDLIKHREKCILGQQKAEEALKMNGKKRKLIGDHEGLPRPSKRPRQVNLVPASVETVYSMPPSTDTPSSPSAPVRPNSQFRSRLALPGQPKPTTPMSSLSTASSSNKTMRTDNTPYVEHNGPPLPTMNGHRSSSTAIPPSQISDTGTSHTPFGSTTLSPIPTTGTNHSDLSATSSQYSNERVSYSAVGSSLPSPMPTSGNSHSFSHTVPSSSSPALTTLFVSNLPDSIIDYGFQSDDFDPNVIYESTHCSKAKYNAFPDDLSDEHIFNAAPRYLAYGNLLKVAARYSNAEIYRRVNEGRPKNVLSSVSTVDSRIRAACSWAADEGWYGFNNVDAVKSWLTKERAKNGLVAKKSISLSEYTKRLGQNAVSTSTMIPKMQSYTGLMAPPPPSSLGTLRSPIAPQVPVTGYKRGREDEADDVPTYKKVRVGQNELSQSTITATIQSPTGSIAPPLYSAPGTPYSPMTPPAPVAGRKHGREEEADDTSSRKAGLGQIAISPSTTMATMQSSAGLIAPRLSSSLGTPDPPTTAPAPVAGHKRVRDGQDDSISAPQPSVEHTDRVITPAYKKARLG